MFEDSVLALVVKNYMDYEYVVGNPPYVNIKNIPDSKQDWYKQLYNSAYGRFDLYILFLERGLEWLTEDGKLGYITSNKSTRSKYGQEIRRIITSQYSLSQYIEFGDISVFLMLRTSPQYLSLIRIKKERWFNTLKFTKLGKIYLRR